MFACLMVETCWNCAWRKMGYKNNWSTSWPVGMQRRQVYVPILETLEILLQNESISSQVIICSYISSFMSCLIPQKSMIRLYMYRIAGNFDGGKYWRIWRLVVIRRNFPFDIFNCITNTGCLRDYPSIFPHESSEWSQSVNIYPFQNFPLYGSSFSYWILHGY